MKPFTLSKTDEEQDTGRPPARDRTVVRAVNIARSSQDAAKIRVWPWLKIN
jgi:hypothetical protein